MFKKGKISQILSVSAQPTTIVGSTSPASVQDLWKVEQRQLYDLHAFRFIFHYFPFVVSVDARYFHPELLNFSS